MTRRSRKLSVSFSTASFNNENGLYRFAVEIDLKALLKEHRKMFGDRRADFILERFVGKEPGSTLIQFIHTDYRAWLSELLVSFGGLVDGERFPSLGVQPSRSDRHLEGVVAVAGSHQRLAAHLEGVVLRNIARDAAAIVFDREMVGGDFALHEMLRVVDVATIREPKRTIKTIVEKVEDRIGEVDVACQHRHEEPLGRARRCLIGGRFCHRQALSLRRASALRSTAVSLTSVIRGLHFRCVGIEEISSALTGPLLARFLFFCRFVRLPFDFLLVSLAIQF